MKKFLKNVALIGTPTLFLFFYVILLGANHNVFSFGKVVRQNAFIIGDSYEKNIFLRYYKTTIPVKNYAIFSIGSSRVLQFKSEMFDTSFFNLGYLASTPRELREVVKRLNIRNKKIIIGLDQWAFNSNWPGCHDYTENTLTFKLNYTEALFNTSRLKSIYSLKILPVLPVRNSMLLGSGANLAIDGILKDGSYYYGKIYAGYETKNSNLIGDDYLFKNTLERIKNGTGRFEYGEYADSIALKDVEQLIQENIRRKNEVYYFFPPFAPKIQKLINNGKYGYIKDAFQKITTLTSYYKVNFFDFTSIVSNDESYIDGFHGGSKLYYDLLIKMGIKVRPVNFINDFETLSDSVYTSLRRNRFHNEDKQASIKNQ